MKKLLVLISILFLSLSLYAIDASLTLGYQYKLTGHHAHDPLYISLNIWQDIGDFKLYGNYTNEMSKTESYMFLPSQDYFTVGASYNFKQITLKIEHQCYHPVVVYGFNKGIDGGYVKIEITIGDK